MKVQEFCQGIALQKEAEKMIEGILTQQDYEDYKKDYESGHEVFFHKVLRKENADSVFLAFYCTAACEVYEKYQEKGIEDSVFFDTFQDITYWCENCRNEFGHYGIHQYDWFWRHLDMTLFRLGRLEFEQMDAENEVVGQNHRIQKGEPVINVHIPQGSRLILEECKEAFEKAFAWFGKECRFVCHSWLLNPGLSEILDQNSNIMQFQSLFEVLEVDYQEKEAEWRIFGKVREETAAYPENTSLQRSVKQYLMQGGKLGNGFGIYKK